MAEVITVVLELMVERGRWNQRMRKIIVFFFLVGLPYLLYKDDFFME
jgi:hypothetical protein